jgi:NAD(P)-dependent dehydrogenase (short-subunit alcohol dehydrogenase family)
MRLENKVGIVTAAASGMGRAGAIRFAREGAAVGVVDIDQAGVDAVVAEITAAGGRALGLVGDLRQDDFARSIVRQTANAFGGLDFVWNHVGHPGPAAIEGIDMADFEIALDLNLRTVLVTTEAAIPEIRARGGGALLCARSPSGSRRTKFASMRSVPARSTRRCCGSSYPGRISSAPPAGTRRSLCNCAAARTRWAAPADPRK